MTPAAASVSSPSCSQPRIDEKEFVFDPTVLRHLVKVARRASADGALALRLESESRVCESVMAPASALFGFLLARDGKTVDGIVKTLREQWARGSPRSISKPFAC